jgi:hypothetical protein
MVFFSFFCISRMLILHIGPDSAVRGQRTPHPSAIHRYHWPAPVPVPNTLLILRRVPIGYCSIVALHPKTVSSALSLSLPVLPGISPELKPKGGISRMVLCGSNPNFWKTITHLIRRVSWSSLFPLRVISFLAEETFPAVGSFKTVKASDQS